jgi:hypothetical protein
VMCSLFGTTASHQHFLKVHIVRYVPKSTCQLFLQLICFFWRAVCTMICVLKLLSVASEVGAILSIETATFANFEP